LCACFGGRGDDLDPVLASDFGRLNWVGGDGGLTGFAKSKIFVGVGMTRISVSGWIGLRRILFDDKLKACLLLIE
jgi:hypothetical protein